MGPTRIDRFEAELGDEVTPSGWVMVKLRVVTSPSGEKVEPAGSNGADYLSLEHVEPHTTRIIGRGTAADVHSTKAVFRAGDVLYGKLRPYLNKVCTPDFDGICSTDFMVFRQSPAINSRYLMWFLNRQEVVEFTNDRMAGVQLPRISFGELGDLDLPLPPRIEQDRIAERIRGLSTHVDAARERLTKVPAILKRFRQAVLTAACSGRLTADWRVENPFIENGDALLDRVRTERAESRGRTRKIAEVAGEFVPELPETWVTTSLDEVCEAIVDCPHSTPKWTADGRLCVRTTNFRPGFLDLSEKSYVSEESYEDRISRLMPLPGDILYSREGGILGIACMIPPSVTLCLGQRMMLLRPYAGFFAAFYMNVLNSRLTLDRVRELTGGTASPHLNVADIKAFPVPVPPSLEQAEIIRRVHSLFSFVDAIERRVAAATARADKLTQSILARAFRGELVPTEAELARQEGRDYEPASALLERIRSGNGKTTQGDLFPEPPRRGRRKKQ